MRPQAAIPANEWWQERRRPGPCAGSSRLKHENEERSMTRTDRMDARPSRGTTRGLRLMGAAAMAATALALSACDDGFEYGQSPTSSTADFYDLKVAARICPTVRPVAVKALSDNELTHQEHASVGNAYIKALKASLDHENVANAKSDLGMKPPKPVPECLEKDENGYAPFLIPLGMVRRSEQW